LDPAVSFNPVELNFPVCFSHLRQFHSYFYDEEGVDFAFLKRIQGHLAVCEYGGHLVFCMYVFCIL
jgi:hypothetical protein